MKVVWKRKCIAFWVIALIFSGLACSKSEPVSVGGDGLVLKSANWRQHSAAGEAFSADDFDNLVQTKMGSVKKNQCTLSGRLKVSGELDTAGDDFYLLLKAKIVTPDDRICANTSLLAKGHFDSPQSKKDFINKAVGDLFVGLNELVSLHGADKSKLYRALLSPEPDVQLLAMDLLCPQMDQAGVLKIGRLLNDPRESVADRAAACLGDSGLAAAATVLIESIQKGDLRGQVRVIEAISKIGGPKVEAYLQMTAVGHPVPEVQKLSADALDKLKNKRR